MKHFTLFILVTIMSLFAMGESKQISDTAERTMKCEDIRFFCGDYDFYFSSVCGLTTLNAQKRLVGYCSALSGKIKTDTEVCEIKSKKVNDLDHIVFFSCVVECSGICEK